MTAEQSITSTIEVSVDPHTAFSVFTEELDCWWMQGAINFYDSARAFDRRMEPGVGGRIMEVYDDARGEGLELGRITIWEPGTRLAWSSSTDDVAIEVTFDSSGQGTVVTVCATIPEDGADRGETSWVRMTPVWFGDWVDKRDTVPRQPLQMARLAIALYYAKPATAARWLRDVYGFEPACEIPSDDPTDDHTWIEFHVGNASVIVLYRDGEADDDAAVTHTPWIFVDDLDAHFERAKANGARIIADIWEHGARAYDSADIEGYRWTFAQASPHMR